MNEDRVSGYGLEAVACANVDNELLGAAAQGMGTRSAAACVIARSGLSALFAMRVGILVTDIVRLFRKAVPVVLHKHDRNSIKAYNSGWLHCKN